ncbi:MAG: PIN domain-containing protein [Candidatus Aenigmatarchaeota archaeon]|nr:PIN domain-containing protein [Candidatus Aenigmarchaeota archaeon]
MIILDTSFIVAFYNIRDENHTRAAKLMRDIIAGKYGELFITDYIFDECMTVIFIRLKNLSETVRIGELIRKSTKFLEIEKSDFEEAWKLFKRQKTTAFSFTDCSTLVIAKENNIKNIATFDEDFLKIKRINVIRT